MKISKKCSECGGKEIYRTSTHANGQGTNLLPSIGSLLRYATLDIYICGQCGHYQMFASEQDLEQIKQRYIPYF